MIIDLSSNNGTVDFTQLQDIDLIFIRATLGYGDFDANLSKNATGADAQGWPIGYYHFAYPHSGVDPAADATKQANYFCDTISKLPAPQELAVDLENFSATTDATISQTDYATWMQSFIDTVISRTGITPIIYTYADYLNRHLPHNHTFGQYKLWLANYSSNLNPTLPMGWTSMWARQYSETGKMAGINSYVDLSKLS